ncbi:MAG: NAD(+)/NADH kinase [Desulfosalsimonadaceae bacterium]
MKRIGLYVKNDRAANEKADAFEAWLRERGIDVFRQKAFETHVFDKDNHLPGAPADLSCVFVIGGDGTFLSASRWIGDAPIPVIGVKFGDVGFLAEISEDALFETAEAVIAGNYRIGSRTRLKARIIRNGAIFVEETVLNDVVINKAALARLANIKTYIDDHYLTTYRSDGLIVSTPTGSTAYSLAAGGPVVHPAVEGIIITPICPFTLTNRPLIVPNHVVIKTFLDEKATDMVVTFDGQEGLEICPGDILSIEKSPYPVHLITLPGQNYFDILKAKLRWSGGRI